MKVSFKGTVEEIVTQIGDFLSIKDVSSFMSSYYEGRGETPGDAKEAAPTEDKPKRTRGKRGAKNAVDPEDAENAGADGAKTDEKPKRRRKAKSKSDTDDVKDVDLVKMASTLADASNPGVVSDMLEEFGVSKVHELDGEARREFLTAASERIEDESDTKAEEEDNTEAEEAAPKRRKSKRS